MAGTVTPGARAAGQCLTRSPVDHPSRAEYLKICHLQKVLFPHSWLSGCSILLVPSQLKLSLVGVGSAIVLLLLRALEEVTSLFILFILFII